MMTRSRPWHSDRWMRGPRTSTRRWGRTGLWSSGVPEHTLGPDRRSLRGASEQPDRQPHRSGPRPPDVGRPVGAVPGGAVPRPGIPRPPTMGRVRGHRGRTDAVATDRSRRPRRAGTGPDRRPLGRLAGLAALLLVPLVLTSCNWLVYHGSAGWLGRRSLGHVLLLGPSGVGLAQAGRTAVRRTAGPRQPGPGGHRRRHRRGPVGHRRIHPVVDHGGGAGPVRRPALRGHHPHRGDHLDTGGRLDAQRGVRGGRRAGGIGRAARSLRARRDDRSRPAGPAGRSPRFRSQGPVATGGPDAGRRTGGHRLRRQLGGLLGLPRVVGGRTRGRRCPHDLRGGRGGRREPGGDLDGRRRPGRGRERQPLGGGRQRLEQHGRRPLRRQRLGARALVLVDAAPVLRPSTWLHDNLTDADLGSSSPAVLPDGLVFQAGKSGTGYLLQGSSLGGIGGQVAQLAGLCGGVVDGGTRSPTPWSTHRAAGEWWPCGWGRRHLR